MAEIDWSQYEVPNQDINWSQYEVPNQEIDWSQYQQQPQNPFMSGLHNFNNAMSSIPQSLWQSGLFGDALAQGSQRYGREQERLAQEGTAQNPRSAFAGELAGDLGSLIGHGSLASLLGGPALSLAGKAVKQPLSMAAKGIGAAVRPVAKEIVKVPSAVKEILPSSMHNIGKKISQNAVKERASSSANFNKVFEAAKNSGVEKINVPKKGLSILRKGKHEDYSEALNKFIKDPSFENAHKAQSSIGKFVRSNTKAKEGADRSDIIKARLAHAKEWQRNLNDEIKIALEKANPKLAKQYSTAKETYKKRVVPYNNSKSLQQYEAGEISAAA